jgi:hypothetical protein
MSGMPNRKGVRSAISVIAVAALLFCQAAWAGMRAPERLSAALGQASSAVAAASCHDPGGGDVPENAAPSPCDSAQLPSEGAKAPLLAPVVLDSRFVMRIASLPALPPVAVELAHPAGIPPPPRLLYCTFRN